MIINDKARKMIKDVATDLVWDLHADALRCAWTSTQIPVLKWEEKVSTKITELLEHPEKIFRQKTRKKQ